MAGSSLMETLFQRTLDDLIKGLRLQFIGESAFISKAMDEIRSEIKSTDPQTKSIALQKLSYLNSLHGIDMSWAAFHVVEVMSSARFAQKKIGYQAASQSFHEGTPVLLLITNQLRKDLNSTNEFEVSLALECLSRIATIDLARDLTSEIFTLLSSSKVLVRKKAIGLVLRVFEKYPDAVRVCFKRLVENLDSADPLTLSAVVGVFCELASQDPKSYLPLAPEFYRILVDSKNNWILIKVLKIFSKLAPLEPRLARRLVEPICEQMRKTGAKSLMFECVRTVVTSLTDYESAVKLAVGKIRELLIDDDPNLKYLGLHALSVVAPKHVWAVSENKDIVIKSLSDTDPNIKLEALRLVMAMVSENNVIEICRVLVNLALKSDPEFCNDILGSILTTCCRNVYEIIIDFDWYVSLLGDMSRVPHCQKGDEIEYQLIDIGMRVKDARPELVEVSRLLLIDPALLGNPFLHRILSAAAWVSGEYVEFSRKPLELIEALLQPRTSLLPPSVRGVYIQSAFKALIYCLHSCISQGDTAESSPVPFSLAPSVSKSTCADASDMALCNPSAPSEEAEAFFNPGASNERTENFTMENGREKPGYVETSTSASLENSTLTLESIFRILNFIESAVGPLSGSHDVEVLERSRNLLCLTGLIREKIPNPVLPIQDFETELSEASKITELILDAFSEELGPVSITAQEKVPLPDGLDLNENLDDLESICGHIELPLAGSLPFSAPHYEESTFVSSFKSLEESEQSNETTSLLTEHRRRHGLYYLPSEKNEIAENDYPRANDPKAHDSLNDDAADLVRLTEQSLGLKRKPNHSKPRPVVVKLDGDELLLKSKKPQPKDDLLSGAVRDVLSASESGPISSQSNPTTKSSSRRKGKEKQTVDHPSISKENLENTEKVDQGNPSSRRRKHHAHGKERHRSPEKIGEKRDQKDEKRKQKSSHRHSRQKARQKADAPLTDAPQTPVIQDFLL